jgi:hypothetical protein
LSINSTNPFVGNVLIIILDATRVLNRKGQGFNNSFGYLMGKESPLSGQRFLLDVASKFKQPKEKIGL